MLTLRALAVVPSESSEVKVASVGTSDGASPEGGVGPPVGTGSKRTSEAATEEAVGGKSRQE